jgi:hypothetical protein
MQKMTKTQGEKYADLKQAKAVALGAIYYATGLVYSAPGTGVWRFLHCFKRSSPEVQKAFEDAEHELAQYEFQLLKSGVGVLDSFGDYQPPAVTE